MCTSHRSHHFIFFYFSLNLQKGDCEKLLKEVKARNGETEQFCLVRASVSLHDGKVAEAEAHLKVSLGSGWISSLTDYKNCKSDIKF